MSPGEASGLSFVKVEGAGNDFVLVDGRRERVSWEAESIRRLCGRHRGVGADGLLYIEPTGDVKYWNADGGAAGFCGNGARCAAAYLLASQDTERVGFRLGDVDVEALRVGEDLFRVSMNAPDGKEMDARELARRLKGIEAGEIRRSALVTAGVPHVVLLAGPRLFEAPPDLWGPPLRRVFHEDRDGVNVDLLRSTASGWRLRTFERGVEGETLCCGSGVLAAGWCLRSWGLASLPVFLQPTGGDRLRVGEDASKEAWFLEGPARIVYRGEVPGP